MPRPTLTDEQRFLSHVRIEDRGYKTPCWIWTGWRNRKGYAQFYYGGGRKNRKTVEAHLWAYRHFVGEVPEGKQLDHLCRVHECGCPYHVEPVTCRENLLRGETLTAKWARRTHCEHGHEYTPTNTYITSQGARVCRLCRAQKARESRASKRSQMEREDVASRLMRQIGPKPDQF